MECPIYIFLCVITKSNNVYCPGLYWVVLCFLLFMLSLHGIKNGKEMKLLIKSCLAVALFAGSYLVVCKEKDMSMKMNNPRNIRGVITLRREELPEGVRTVTFQIEEGEAK